MPQFLFNPLQWKSPVFRASKDHVRTRGRKEEASEGGQERQQGDGRRRQGKLKQKLYIMSSLTISHFRPSQPSREKSRRSWRRPPQRPRGKVPWGAEASRSLGRSDSDDIMKIMMLMMPARHQPNINSLWLPHFALLILFLLQFYTFKAE